MSAHFEPQLVKRTRPTRPTREINPHNVHLIGGPAVFDLVIDAGTAEPVTTIRLTADLAAHLRAKLNQKNAGDSLVGQ